MEGTARVDDFNYKEGELHCEDVPATVLVERFGSPLYVYSRRTLVQHYQRVRDAFAPVAGRICFSVKSCSNLSVLRLLCQEGAWFDVVSGGELHRAMEAGASPEQIVFAGVGKSDAEIETAISAGIGRFNVESVGELQDIAQVAKRMERTACVAIRVNPDVDANTHEYTTTGTAANKFGIAAADVPAIFDKFARESHLTLDGLHVHIGSPVNTIEPYVAAVGSLRGLADRLSESGHSVRSLNIGGGFGAHYEGSEAPTAASYAEQILPLLRGFDGDVLLEPGRSIAANAGILLTRVLYTKKNQSRTFVICDAAINDLLRPALYGAFHFVWPATPQHDHVPSERRRDLSLPGCEPVDVVGPVCESGDFLAKDRALPPVARGDVLAVFSAGAYGFSMSSQYNSRPRPAEVLVSGSEAQVIRRRESYDDLVSLERVGDANNRTG